VEKGLIVFAFGDQGGSFRENRPPGPPAKAFHKTGPPAKFFIKSFWKSGNLFSKRNLLIIRFLATGVTEITEFFYFFSREGTRRYTKEEKKRLEKVHGA
jgi:hypothetical protein